MPTPVVTFTNLRMDTFADCISADILVDNQKVGWFERVERDGDRRYLVHVFDGPEAAVPMLHLDGRDYSKLLNAKRAVQNAYSEWANAKPWKPEVQS